MIDCAYGMDEPDKKEFKSDKFIYVQKMYIQKLGYISLFYPKDHPEIRLLYLGGNTVRVDANTGKSLISMGLKICSEIRKAEKFDLDLFMKK